MDARELQNILLEYDLLIKIQFSQKCKLWRTWIESPPGKYRPLGVSSLPWRIYLKGLTIFLENNLRGSWDPTQHAYMSGRGTFTCWKDIITKALKARDIYEYDFKGFFNNVNLDSVALGLKKIGLPNFVIAHVINMAASEIRSPKVRKMLEMMVNENGYKALLKYEFIYNFRKNFRFKALPQGQGMSPILSVFLLRWLNSLPFKSIKYADDGLFYGDLPENPLEEAMKVVEPLGAIFSKEKSGWVKKNGEWLKPLKFVGLTYDPFNDLIKASTRKGSKLTLLGGIIAFFKDVSFIRSGKRSIDVNDRNWDKLLDQLHYYKKVTVCPEAKVDNKEKRHSFFTFYRIDLQQKFSWVKHFFNITFVKFEWWNPTSGWANNYLQIVRNDKLSIDWHSLWRMSTWYTWFDYKVVLGSQYFNTLLARLYTGSWESQSVKQDFRYKYIHGSLASWFRKYGPGQYLMTKLKTKREPMWTHQEWDWKERFDRESLLKNVNVFNAASFYCHVLIHFLRNEEDWRLEWSNKKMDLQRSAMLEVLYRLSTRRTGNRIERESLMDPNLSMQETLLETLLKPKFQLPRRKYILLARQYRKSLLKGNISIHTIANSMKSEGFVGMDEWSVARDWQIPTKPVNCRWFTWDPYKKGQRKHRKYRHR